MPSSSDASRSSQAALHFVVLYGSYRRDRNGIRAVKLVKRHLEDRGHQVSVIDALEADLPMLDRMYSEYPKGEAPQAMERIAQTLRQADGFLVVTGEYNHSLQPGLSNLLDHFMEEYFWRPSAIVSYSVGRIAGMRAAVHLRVLLAEIGTPSIPSIFGIGNITTSLSESGEDQTGKLNPDKFLSELEWYSRALKQQRSQGTPY